MSGTTVMTRLVARLLLLPACMIALAILVKGYADTGDGFSAGVIVGIAILLQMVACGFDAASCLWPVRHALPIAIGGLLLALVVTFLPVLRGDPLMTHWPPAGEKVVHLGTLELMTPVLFDVGVFLLVTGFITGSVAQIARVIADGERAP